MSELTSANWSETAASNNAAPPNGFPEGMNPSDVNNGERENMSALKKWFNRTSVTLTLGGGTTAYTAAPAVALAAYADEIWTWIMPSTNAVTATLNISTLGARNIQKFIAGAWADVAAGDLPSGAYIAAKYDTGTSKFRIIWNSASSLSAGVVTNAMLADMTGPAFKARSSGTGAPQDVAAFSVMALVSAGNNGIGGLAYQNNGSDAINDIDIATGGAMDSTGAYWLALASALTKRLDVSWAVGTNQGGILSGAAANVDYNVWLIGDVTNKVVDVGFETTANATPTLPGVYTVYRKIGWFKRAGGTIVAFHTYEVAGGSLEFKWDAPRLDIDLANTLTTARRTDALSVPLNFSTTAMINVVVTDAGAGFYARVCCPDETDAAPSGTAAPLANLVASAAGDADAQQMFVRTSAAGLIAARATIATIDVYKAVTDGFIWSRR